MTDLEKFIDMLTRAGIAHRIELRNGSLAVTLKSSDVKAVFETAVNFDGEGKLTAVSVREWL